MFERFRPAHAPGAATPAASVASTVASGGGRDASADFRSAMDAFDRGDGSSTKRAAQDYLQRFPAGFRRAEVEALTR